MIYDPTETRNVPPEAPNSVLISNEGDCFIRFDLLHDRWFRFRETHARCLAPAGMMAFDEFVRRGLGWYCDGLQTYNMLAGVDLTGLICCPDVCIDLIFRLCCYGEDG
jgi:hypothetical protein